MSARSAHHTTKDLCTPPRAAAVAGRPLHPLRAPRDGRHLVTGLLDREGVAIDGSGARTSVSHGTLRSAAPVAIDGSGARTSVPHGPLRSAAPVATDGSGARTSAVQSRGSLGISISLAPGGATCSFGSRWRDRHLLPKEQVAGSARVGGGARRENRVGVQRSLSRFHLPRRAKRAENSLGGFYQNPKKLE